MKEIDDVRTWVGGQAFGMLRFMLDTQAALEDVEGAHAAGQLATVAQQTRSTVIRLLWLESIRETDGFIEAPFDWPSWNPLPRETERTEAGLALVSEMASACLAEDRPAIEDCLTALRDLARSIESEYAGQDVLPRIRGADGMFPALKLASRWIPLVEAVGLPEVLPDNWRVTGDGVDADGSPTGGFDRASSPRR